MITDANGDQYMVNGQRLTVYFEQDVVPLHYVDIYTIKDEPEHLA